MVLLLASTELDRANDATVVAGSAHPNRGCALEHACAGKNEVALVVGPRVRCLWVPQAQPGAFFDHAICGRKLAFEHNHEIALA